MSLIAAPGLYSGGQVWADDWMFRRSYFSHVQPPGAEEDPSLPQSRSAYRTAYYRQAFGFRSSYRINNNIIRNGARFDWTRQTEGWIEPLP
jgi:hypothetical protein